ncbi:hypothetical protein, partial [Salmonella enterica]|uniref:hypothetical protein n=5 Tax=Salmonella TaxID=590 RepID=UPI001CA3D1DE
MPLKFIRRVSGGFSGGLLSVLSVSRQKCPQRLSGGAGNGCYGKSNSGFSACTVWQKPYDGILDVIPCCGGQKKSRNHDCMSRDGKVASEIRVRENAVHHITHDTRAAGVTGMLWESYFAQTPSIFFPSRAR